MYHYLDVLGAIPANTGISGTSSRSDLPSDRTIGKEMKPKLLPEATKIVSLNLLNMYRRNETSKAT